MPPDSSPTLDPAALARGREGRRHHGLFAHVTPNWFAAVMGTGIVATAGAELSWQPPWMHGFTLVFWVLASVALVALTTALFVHWTRHRTNALDHARDMTVSPFYGAPPMALVTVASGTVLVGDGWIGSDAAWTVGWTLWVAGAATGLVTAVWVPFRMITHPDVGPPVPAWLMPIVPPLVAASTGSLFVAQVPAGQPRLGFLMLCFGMLGLSMVGGLLVTTLVFGRLLRVGLPSVQLAPTVWILLGLMGQSVTAVTFLADDSAGVFGVDGVRVTDGLQSFAILYGMLMGGFAALVFALAIALTVHAGRRGLGFTLAWWSFTFPVGTCATGATALGEATGATAIGRLGVCLYALLVVAWATVAGLTGRDLLTREAFEG